MRLLKLQISGFKSFPDKTTITFPDGISAIIGPNGCGKSNIVDAICWASGEQSVKQLRGKAMEDVIFAGASTRPSMNMAEVSITFQNDGGAPEEYGQCAEITVTRRLFRSGESGYFINRQNCRLKDIQHLLMGSGMGSRAYAVIQQGNIGAITEAGPEDRRVHVEEAAGVTRYKSRKKEAQAKIESTKQNLARVLDIISEVDRNMAGVKRQAQKAERYNRWRERAMALEVALARRDVSRFSEGLAELAAERDRLTDEDLSKATALASLLANLEDTKVCESMVESEAAMVGAERSEAARRMDRLEGSLQNARNETQRLQTEKTALSAEREELLKKALAMESERGECQAEKEGVAQELALARARVAQGESASRELQRALQALKGELEEKKAGYMELSSDQARYRTSVQNATSNKAQIARKRRQKAEEVESAVKRLAEMEDSEREAQEALAELKARCEELEADISQTEGLLEACRKDVRNALARVHELELKLGKKKSRLSALKKMEGNYEWFQEGVRALMRRRAEAGPEARDGILALVAEVIQPEKGLEDAVEAALGPALQFVVARDVAAGLAAADRLTAEGQGRAGFVPLGWEEGEAPLTWTGPGETLLSRVSVTEGYETVAQRLLSHVILVSDRAEALSVRRVHKNGILAVTPDGAFGVGPQGFWGGSREGARPGILAQKAEIRDLEAEVRALEGNLEAARKEGTELEARLRGLEDALQKKIRERRELAASEMETQKDAARVAEQTKNARRNLEIAELDRDRLMGEEDDADLELEKYDRLLKAVDQDVGEAKQSLDEAGARIGLEEAKILSMNQAAMDEKLSMTGLSARMEHLEKTEKRLLDYEKETRERVSRLGFDLEKKESLILDAGKWIEKMEADLASGYEELARLSARLEEAGGRREALGREILKFRAEVTAIEDSRKKAQARLRDLEILMTQDRLRLENLEARIQERYGKTLEELKLALDTPATLDETQAREAGEELLTLKDKMARLGDVNLSAIAEYAALEERFGFLVSQKEDLMSAVEDLEKVIRKINRYTQARFMETLALVNEKLAEVFPRLFNGGQARLELTDPEKPLESGVEYLIHPPGKKVTRMSLLSGGEKAMAALAFVFAIFLIRPASFCLMDEVDAPLDDANVDRFKALLKLIGEKSQILMITHNKSAMEFADVLFGVTMEKKGVSKLVSVNLEKGQFSDNMAA